MRDPDRSQLVWRTPIGLEGQSQLTQRFGVIAELDEHTSQVVASGCVSQPSTFRPSASDKGAVYLG